MPIKLTPVQIFSLQLLEIFCFPVFGFKALRYFHFSIIPKPGQVLSLQPAVPLVRCMRREAFATMEKPAESESKASNNSGAKGDCLPIREHLASERIFLS